MGDISSLSDLYSSIDSILDRSLPRTTTGFIRRVSKELRKGNECHYTPTTVAIGPLHANLEPLQATKELKLLYFQFFVNRLQGGRRAVVNDLIQVVENQEDEVRGLYGGGIELKRDEFVKMLLIDGCFIIELFLRYNNRINLKEEDDPIFQGGRPRWTMLFDLQRDLILLENQIPYSLLEALYLKCPDNTVTLSTLAHCFLRSIMPKDRTSSTLSSMSKSRQLNSSAQTELPVKSPPPPQTIPISVEFPPRNLTPTVAIRDFKDHRDTRKLPYLHLLDFVWNDFIPSTYSQERNQGAKCEYIGIPCASEMELYGVKFERQEVASLIEVQFKSGVMKIPCMVFRETTTTLFWNLLAMEQIPSNTPRPLFFTSYAFFMDSLIRSEKDVELLCRNGIIRSRVNDLKEVGRLFNNLSMNTSIDNLESINLYDAYKHVNKYCSSGIWRFRAYLVRNYYDVRWDILNSLLLLILTTTQTVFSGLQHDNKKG